MAVRTVGQSSSQSVSRSVGLSVCRTVRLSIPSIRRSGCPTGDRSVCWSVGQSIRQPIGLSDSRSVGLSVRRSVGLSDSRSVGLSVCRSRGLVGGAVGQTDGLSVCRCQSGPRACFFYFGSSAAPFCRSGGAFGFICKVLGSTLGCPGRTVGRSGGHLSALGGLFGVRGHRLAATRVP